MKKILIASLIILLSVAVLILALKLRRLSPPEDYEYSLRSDIDADYYDQSALKDYYATGYAIGSFAREMWHDRGINVRFADSDNASDRAATQHYNGMKAYADSLGARLARSKQLKEQGLRNSDVKLLEDGSTTPEQLSLLRNYHALLLGKGERSSNVLTLQTQLTALGYVIPTDGYYWEETATAIRDFQGKHGLLISGIADEQTLQALLKAAPLKTH